MDVFVKSSQSYDVSLAVEEATEGLINPKLILYFAPTKTFKEITSFLNKKYPAATIVGSSSHCIYCNAQVDMNSFSVTAFYEDIVFKAGTIPEITRYPLKFADEIRENLLSINTNTITKDNTICLEFTSAFSYSEELVLQTLDSICSPFNIQLVGGTAGTNKYQNDFTSYVSLNGNILQEGCVYIFIKNLNGKIKIYKENIYKPTEYEFTATNVNVGKRIVNSFNNESASSVIMRALECDANTLPEQLIEHPLGRIVENDYYISAFDKLYEDESISWASRIYNNTKVSLLKLDDYKSIVKSTVNSIKKDFSSPSLVFLIQCEIRVNIFERENYLQEFQSNYSDSFPVVSGFSSHGEQINKIHLNQYLLVIVFE